jgi:biotin transport system substrate-specific component
MTISVPSLQRVPAAERGLTIADFLVPVRVAERIGPAARHAALVVAGALLVALAAQVRIDLPDNPVPITGQTFGVLLVGGALGFRRGGLALALYVLMGFFLPVYAGGASGLNRIIGFDEGRLVLGATGGYLLGFVVAGALVGRLAELGWDRRLLGAVVAMAVGNVVIYLFGVPWLMAATGMALDEAIAKGVVPFLVGDAIKLGLAGAAFPAAWWVVGRLPEER